MLKAFIYGAAAALIGSRLKKMNDEGRLEPYKNKARERAQRLSAKISEERERLQRRDPASNPSKEGPSGQAVPPQASSHARKSDSDEVSRPARAHPWPVDPRALPSEN